MFLQDQRNFAFKNLSKKLLVQFFGIGKDYIIIINRNRRLPCKEFVIACSTVILSSTEIVPKGSKCENVK